MRAGLDASWSLARGQPVAAHVALANDALTRVELGRIVRAGQRAILAAEALVVEVPDNSRERVLFVGVDRAGVEAGRIEAMMARGCHMLEDRQLRPAADNEADVAPGLALVQPVEIVAGRHAGLAAGTPVEIDLERELLPGAWRPGR